MQRKTKDDSYHCIISYELDKRRDELDCDDYQWVNLEIITEVDKVCIEDLQLE